MLHSFFSQHIDQIGQALLGIGLFALGYVNKKYFKKTEVKTEQIHILVNSRLSEALERINQLETHLDIEPGTPISELKAKNVVS